MNSTATKLERGIKNFEWRRQIGKFEKGNAEERGVYFRC
jgi:hypothetical protein